MPRRTKVSDLTPTGRLLRDARRIARRLGIETGGAETSTPVSEPSPQAAPPAPGGNAERAPPERPKPKRTPKQSKKQAPPKKPKKRTRPKQRQRATAKPCTRCGVIKRPKDFHRNSFARDGRHSACAACRRESARGSLRAAEYPACSALGVGTAKDALRDLAWRHGFDSALELEVAARMASQGVDVEREGLVIRYRDGAGELRRWTPDFLAASGAVIEAKGRVPEWDQRVIPLVLDQCPWLDLRLVLQSPHVRGGVTGSTMTPAEWAEGLGIRWTTLDGLELVTMDLPRAALTDEGDRVIPGWVDDGMPAERMAAELWSVGRAN